VTSLVASALKTEAKSPKAAVNLQRTRETPWQLSAGAQWRQFGALSFQSDSQASSFALPTTARSSSSGYTDGFVSLDSSGGSTTWNWGYDNASQVSGTTLSFHSTLQTMSTLRESMATDWSDDLDGAGAFIELQSPELLAFHGASLSASLGYSWSRADASNDQIAFRAEQQLVTNSAIDRYDVSGVFLPPAPYAGSFNGPGPTINTSPTSRKVTELSRHTLDSFTSTLHSTLRVDLHTLSLGPDASFDYGRFTATASTGLALNIANWTASTREDLRSGNGTKLASWQERSTGTEVVPSFYLATSGSYALSPRWSVQTTARYDWASRVEGDVAGSHFDLDLAGWTLMLGASYKF
jgi:hypothetical protein